MNNFELISVNAEIFKTVEKINFRKDETINSKVLQLGFRESILRHS